MTPPSIDEGAERSLRLAQLLDTMATVLTDFNEHLQAAEADAPRRQKLLERFATFIEHASPTLREAATLLHGTRIVAAHGESEPDGGDTPSASEAPQD